MFTCRVVSDWKAFLKKIGIVKSVEMKAVTNQQYNTFFTMFIKNKQTIQEDYMQISLKSTLGTDIPGRQMFFNMLRVDSAKG